MAADFDGNGITDLAVANAGDNKVSIFLGRLPSAILSVTKSHSGNFVGGQVGAAYTISVTNSGSAALNGTVVAVSDTLPTGLTATSFSGGGWSCTLATLTCTRSDALAPAASFPAITLTVNVAIDAPASVTNTVTASGGGAAAAASASDPTTILPPTVSATVQTNPNGRSFVVDGTTYTSAQTFTWTLGSQHTIGTSSPQAGATGVQYVFANWSDAGALSHAVIAAAGGSFTANFTIQYLLTTAASPANGGTVGPASAYYNAGQSVVLSATANQGNAFSGWTGTGTGSYTGSNSGGIATMNGPVTEVATFTTTTDSRIATGVMRDTNGSIRLSKYPSSALSNSGGIFASDPSVAQDLSGNTFVTARDAYNSIWANVYNPNTSSWSGWQFGGGIIQGVPAMTVTPTGHPGSPPATPTTPTGW